MALDTAIVSLERVLFLIPLISTRGNPESYDFLSDLLARHKPDTLLLPFFVATFVCQCPQSECDMTLLVSWHFI
jgi:hypothetical protein